MPKHLLPKGLCKFIKFFIYGFCGVFYRIIIVNDAFTFDNLYKVYSSLYYKSHVKWMMYFILVFLKEMKITNQWPSLDCMIEKNTHLINRKKYFEFLDIKKTGLLDIQDINLQNYSTIMIKTDIFLAFIYWLFFRILIIFSLKDPKWFSLLDATIIFRFGNMGYYEKAINCFESALKYDPKHVNGRKYLCETLLEFGKRYEKSLFLWLVILNLFWF